ncbi:FAD-dependent oxidoreductase [Desulforamulus aeronauticus]|nr:FAD-dependent oxidoreductase [Desulforamulus aeronauticus]
MTLALLIFMLSLGGYWVSSSGQKMDVVIVGGGFDGCAAARSAAVAAPDKKILLVVTEPVQSVGGLGTVGGQNFTDIRLWQGQLVTQGSFGRWFAKAGQFYSTERMTEIIREDLSQFNNIKTLYSYDIEQVATDKNKIKELTLRNISRKESGEVGWGQDVKKINGKIFIDASVDGRLTRLAGNTVSVGRADWPATYLPAPENGTLARQQAATLMFQVKGVKTPPKNMRIKDWEFVRDAKGSWGLAGGKEAFTSNPKVVGFNEQYSPQGFAIKPINAAANGKDSDVWWINCLLVFNVDGRAHQRDKGSSLYPSDLLPEHLNVDEAWVKAREFINTDTFIDTLREFKVQNPSTGEWYGFGEAELVRENHNLPIVGQSMYIRESLHSATSNELNTNEENNHYAITTNEAQSAQSHASGTDADNYQTRIGLGYYMMDINAFVPEDLKATGQYDWPVTKHLRPDWEAAGGQPKNPVYLPLEALLPSHTQNLLVPGYGASISSFAWAELRVLPNLAVLGDAAGVTAVRSLNVTKPPGSLSKEDITWIQEKLKSFGARLDK